LLLPLGTWLQESAAWKRMAVLPLALAGLLVAVLHVAMNVSYVFYREGYTNMPGYEYLFLPEKSQLAAHWRALVAWDNRVDLWLVEVWRRQGATAFVPIGVSLLWFLSWSVRQVKYYLAETESNVEVPEREHLQLF
jgi:4-amino-4-deoxy-L-arabinose transferase-like glycosyltransferase